METALVVEMLVSLLESAQRVGSVLKKAQDEGRDVTAEELTQLQLDDNKAREALNDAIDEAMKE